MLLDELVHVWQFFSVRIEQVSEFIDDSNATTDDLGNGNRLKDVPLLNDRLQQIKRAFIGRFDLADQVKQVVTFVSTQKEIDDHYQPFVANRFDCGNFIYRGQKLALLCIRKLTNAI